MIHRARVVVGLVAAALLLATLPATAAAPQSGLFIELESASGGRTQIIELSLAADRMRLDTDMGFSLVSIGGDDGKMLMIQHPQRQYMEFTAEMMEAMAGMMGQMPQQEIEDEMEDMTPPTFTRTGNTKQVGEWSAYEVLVQHPDDDDMTMWFSQDLDIDFRGLAQRLIESMASLVDNPMTRMSGGNDMSDAFAQFEAQMNAADMPDGFPVQIITNAGGDQTTSTLRAIDESASFDAATWEAPEGYSKMEIPFIRR